MQHYFSLILYNYYINFLLHINYLKSLKTVTYSWYLQLALHWSVSKPNQAANCCHRHITWCLKDSNLQCNIIKIAILDFTKFWLLSRCDLPPQYRLLIRTCRHQIDIRDSSCYCNTVKRSRQMFARQILYMYKFCMHVLVSCFSRVKAAATHSRGVFFNEENVAYLSRREKKKQQVKG